MLTVDRGGGLPRQLVAHIADYYFGAFG